MPLIPVLQSTPFSQFSFYLKSRKIWYTYINYWLFQSHPLVCKEKLDKGEKAVKLAQAHIPQPRPGDYHQ